MVPSPHDELTDFIMAQADLLAIVWDGEQPREMIVRLLAQQIAEFLIPGLLATEAKARRTDPETSHLAAREISVRSRAFRVLRSYSNGDDLLDYEAYQRAGMLNVGSTTMQRCADLRQAGYIVRTGERRRLPTTHRLADVSRITPAGRWFLAAKGGTNGTD